MKKILLFAAALVAAMSMNAQTVTEYTCADAAAAALLLPENNKPGTDSVIVTGYITKSLSQWSKGQQRFWMADSPDGGQVFQAYYANLPEPYLSNQTALPEGTKLKMGGYLMKYNTTAEMKNGWVIEVLEVPEVKIDTTTIPSVDIAVSMASAWEVGKTSTDFFIVRGTVKAVTFDYQASDYVPGYPGRQSFTLLTYAQDSIDFIAYNCNMKEEVFVNDSVEILGNLQRFEAKKVEILNGKAEVLQKGQHEEAHVYTVSRDSAIAIAQSHEQGWLSIDTFIVENVTVDSISYEYQADKGTQSFYSVNAEGKNFIAYSCKVPRELVVGDVVTVTGKLQNYKGDAEIKNGTVTLAEAIDNIFSGEKAIKRIENGQVVIIRNGVRFNALGAQIK